MKTRSSRIPPVKIIKGSDHQMKPIKLKGKSYRIDPQSPGVIFDIHGNRLSEKTVNADLGLSSEEGYRVLLTLSQDEAKKHQCKMTSDKFNAILNENLMADSSGRELSKVDLQHAKKGVNYTIIPLRNQTQLAEVLQEIRSRHNFVFRRVAIRHPNLNKINFGRLAKFARSPWTQISANELKTIPILLPPLSEFLLRLDGQ